MPIVVQHGKIGTALEIASRAGRLNASLIRQAASERRQQAESAAYNTALRIEAFREAKRGNRIQEALEKTKYDNLVRHQKLAEEDAELRRGTLAAQEARLKTQGEALTRHRAATLAAGEREAFEKRVSEGAAATREDYWKGEDLRVKEEQLARYKEQDRLKAAAAKQKQEAYERAKEQLAQSQHMRDMTTRENNLRQTLSKHEQSRYLAEDDSAWERKRGDLKSRIDEVVARRKMYGEAIDQGVPLFEIYKDMKAKATAEKAAKATKSEVEVVRDQLRAYRQKYGDGIPPRIADAYLAIAGGDPKKSLKWQRLDGWTRRQ